MVGRLPLSGNPYLLRIEEVWPGGMPAVADQVTIAERQYTGDGILFVEKDPGTLGMMLRGARRLGVRGTHGAAVREGARRGSARVLDADRASDLLAKWQRGTTTTRGSPSTWLTHVRGPLLLWSYWKEKLAMPTVVQQRVSVTLQGCRLRFSVTSQPQSALFREAKLQTEICGPSRNPPRSLAGGCSSAFAQLRHSP